MTTGQGSFAGKVVLITGATSGIGKACAIMFAQAGASVAVADVNPELGAQTVAELQQIGANALFIKTDVSNSVAVGAMVSKTVETFGKLDVAVNNAGISPKPVPVHEIDEDNWARVMAIDLTGAMLCMKYELRQMIAAGQGGAIVNTASIAGIVPEANSGPYVAAKAGVIGLTKGAAIENAHRGIRVNAVAPGWVRTAMTKAWEEDKAYFEKLKAAAPMHRGAEPEEIASTVLYLASPGAAFITGQTLVIDGGQTIRGLFPVEEDRVG